MQLLGLALDPLDAIRVGLAAPVDGVVSFTHI